MILALLLTVVHGYAQTQAINALKEFQSICARGDAQLWGSSLCGRMVLVNPFNRQAVSTHRDPANSFQEKDGFFVGGFPAEIMLANTSFKWGGEQWSMVMLPLPDETFSRLRLLAHESFHRLQTELNLSTSDSTNGHLDSESGRLWLRLELRALAQAVRSVGAQQREAAQDAMLFRAARRHLNPGASEKENVLEIMEGIPEYTGSVVALKATGESLSRVARSIENSEDQKAFARSFAYGTGPGLGILLDAYAGNWRKSLKKDTDLTALLTTALGMKPQDKLIEAATARAGKYGYRAIAPEEHARAIRTQQQLAVFKARFVDSPVLQFPKTSEMQRSFNPSNLVTFGVNGTVYPTGIFTSRWGKLSIEDVGGLLSPDNQILRVVAPADPSQRPVKGPGWLLELAPGWTVQPSAKPGSFEVVAQQ